MELSAQLPMLSGKLIRPSKRILRQNQKCWPYFGRQSTSDISLVLNLWLERTTCSTYLKKFPDSSSRLMRSSLKLSIRFYSRTQARNEDCSCRCSEQIYRRCDDWMSGGTLSQESVLREQAKEKFGAKIKPGNYSTKCEFFRDDIGLVYWRQPNDKHQLLVPQILVHDVIRGNHDLAYAAHPGVKRTCYLLAHHLWWPGMRRSVEDYIRKCDACQRREENREFIALLGDPEMPVAPSK